MPKSTNGRTTSRLVVAFNKKIEEELNARQARGELPSGVDIKTCNSLGYLACRQVLKSALEPGFTWQLINTRYPDWHDADYRTALAKAIKFAKGSALSSRDDVVHMVLNMLDAGQIATSWTDKNEDVNEFAEVVLEMMQV